MLDRRIILAGLAGLAGPWVAGGAARSKEPGLPEPLLYTPELARRLEPAAFPFAAEYSKGPRHLMFIAAQHEIGRATRTAALIGETVARFQPRMIVVEGLPAALGRNPPETVARLQHEAGVTDGPTVTEMRIAAELAVRNGVPFQGGEPDSAAVFADLRAQGFDREDLVFADLIKVAPSLVRGGQISSVDDPRFLAGYPRLAAGLAREVGTEPLSLERFRAKYAEIFGVAPEGDPLLASRAAPGAANVVARILQAQTQARDRNVLRVIVDALDRDGKVLAAYGGSHWTTLSAALSALLGAPVFDLRLSTPRATR